MKDQSDIVGQWCWNRNTKWINAEVHEYLNGWGERSCTTLFSFIYWVLGNFTRTEIRSNKVDSSWPYFRSYARALTMDVQTQARTRTRPCTCTHTSVHLFALRSSPRPLATLTPYVHCVPWNYSKNVHASKKIPQHGFIVLGLDWMKPGVARQCLSPRHILPSHLSRSFHGSDALLRFVDSCVKEGCKILSLVAQL